MTDGRTANALTAAHVAGRTGTESSAPLSGTVNPIGTADGHQVTQRLFKEVYPTLPGEYVYSCLDAGLIRLNSVRNWVGGVRGIGAVGDLFSIDMNTLSLSLIGTPVRAYGAASGLIEGQILALFFRYQALGGFDYVADLLVGPRKGGLRTRPGDSGSVFFYDHVRASIDAAAQRARASALSNHETEEAANEAAQAAAQSVLAAYSAAEKAGAAPASRPLALQWGGQRFFGAPAAQDGSSFPFALATSLSTICRALSVEIIRGWDIALPEYWGEVGHFTIGETACGLLSGSQTLKSLFQNNRRNIGFDDSTISNGGQITSLGPGGFVPLADVPDDVWKKGGAGVKRTKDNPTHYADMDEKGSDGKTLFKLCENHANINPQVWLQHYESIGTASNQQGSLPFRVKQIFEIMVQHVNAGRVTEFVCAAGILAHYVGDACQPLHGSRLADQNGVHSPYETIMLNNNRGGAHGLVSAVKAGIGSRTASGDIASGQDAAVRLVELMLKVSTILPPTKIIQVWGDVGGPHSPNYSDMWAKLGPKTGQCMAEGALLLASLWQSAWHLGNGDAHIQSTATVNYEDLRKLFEPNGTPQHGVQFLPSLYLHEY